MEGKTMTWDVLKTAPEALEAIFGLRPGGLAASGYAMELEQDLVWLEYAGVDLTDESAIRRAFTLNGWNASPRYMAAMIRAARDFAPFQIKPPTWLT
jgi:hypothetical protein